MPRRAPPDRDACEAVLPPNELLALREHAERLDIPPDRWDRVPNFATHWSMVAVTYLAEDLRSERSLTLDRATVIASGLLGLNAETVRSRLRSFFQQARGL